MLDKNGGLASPCCRNCGAGGGRQAGWKAGSGILLWPSLTFTRLFPYTPAPRKRGCTRFEGRQGNLVKSFIRVLCRAGSERYHISSGRMWADEGLAQVQSDRNLLTAGLPWQSGHHWAGMGTMLTVQTAALCRSPASAMTLPRSQCTPCPAQLTPPSQEGGKAAKGTRGAGQGDGGRAKV